VSRPLRQPWWEQLPDNFSRQANGLQLGLRHWPAVHATATLEHLIRVPLATLVAASAWPALTQPGRADREFEALRFYEPLARAGDASRVFIPPPSGIRIETRRSPPRCCGPASIAGRCASTARSSR
jgi:hypothetical protein